LNTYFADAFIQFLPVAVEVPNPDQTQLFYLLEGEDDLEHTKKLANELILPAQGVEAVQQEISGIRETLVYIILIEFDGGGVQLLPKLIEEFDPVDPDDPFLSPGRFYCDDNRFLTG